MHCSRAAAARLAPVVVTAAVLLAACGATRSASAPSIALRATSGTRVVVTSFGANPAPVSWWHQWRAHAAGVARAAVESSTTTTTTSTSSTSTTTSTVAAPPPPTVPPCASSLPAQMASVSDASQIITVVAPDSESTYATLTAWQRAGHCWHPVLGPFVARVGYSGITTDKHEGDDATPAGIYGFEATMYGIAPNPGVHFAYWHLQCGDWWDEDPASPEYNRFVIVPCSEAHPPFDNGASEALWTEANAAPSSAVINYNPADVPGAGSAIFLHADIGTPTEGCVSIPLGQLDEVLDWMLPEDHPAIAMGTTETITSY